MNESLIDIIISRAKLLGKLVQPKLYGEKIDSRFWFQREKQLEDVNSLRRENETESL